MPVTPCMSSSLWMRQERAQRYWPACSRGRPGQRGGDVTLCAETTDSFTAMLLLFHVTLHVFGPYWMAYRKLFSNTRREKCRLVMMLFGTTYASSMLFCGRSVTEISMYRTTFSKPWRELVGTLLWSPVRDVSVIPGLIIVQRASTVL